MRSADAIARTLEAQGVTTIFALSGNQIMPLFDALFDSPIRIVHTRHEAAAVFMAEAHAQITGGVGVALVTAGGGLGNAAGALIAARASDTPVLLLSGDSPVARDGQGAFQEMQQTSVTASLTKGSRRVMQADDMASDLDWALKLATSGRPGPVHLALPADVLIDQTDIATAQSEDNGTPLTQLGTIDFGHAKRPLILLGPALTDTREPGLAAALSRGSGAPVLVMESPRGLNDPALGRIRDVAAEADHVLCLGKEVDFTLAFGGVKTWPNVKRWDVVLGEVAQLQSAKGNLGDRIGQAILMSPVLAAAEIAERQSSDVDRADWLERVNALTHERVASKGVEGIPPQTICSAVQTQIDDCGDVILVADGGEFGQWSQSLVTAPRRVINGVSGVIGGGLCYAMAAKAGAPDAKVFVMMGDGTIGFHLAEFETAVRENLPFVAVIGNDRRWNAEHLIQGREFGEERQFACGLSDARYDLAVAALGGFGAFVTQASDLDNAIAEAIASGRPACVNVAMTGLPAPTF